MEHTFYQMYFQFVFAVNKRENLIPEKHRDVVEKYITGILKKRNVKPLAIYCNPDHCHMFIAPPPEITLASIIRDVKSVSSRFIKKNLSGLEGFSWQSGYAAFSHSKSDVKTVGDYIYNQGEYHKTESFRDEYKFQLTQNGIEFDERYLFKWYD